MKSEPDVYSIDDLARDGSTAWEGVRNFKARNNLKAMAVGDEVLFYHRGEFFSRTGIAPGMLTFHPQGIHHGPQPRAAERVAGATRTDEVAVMIDTRRPLHPTAAAAAIELADYWTSWQEPTP